MLPSVFFRACAPSNPPPLLHTLLPHDCLLGELGVEALLRSPRKRKLMTSDSQRKGPRES